MRFVYVLHEFLGEVDFERTFEDHRLRALPVGIINHLDHLKLENFQSWLPTSDVDVEEIHGQRQLCMHRLDLLIELSDESARRAIE